MDAERLLKSMERLLKSILARIERVDFSMRLIFAG
jgi:hypothetical protein